MKNIIPRSATLALILSAPGLHAGFYAVSNAKGFATNPIVDSTGTLLTDDGVLVAVGSFAGAPTDPLPGLATSIDRTTYLEFLAGFTPYGAAGALDDPGPPLDLSGVFTIEDSLPPDPALLGQPIYVVIALGADLASAGEVAILRTGQSFAASAGGSPLPTLVSVGKGAGTTVLAGSDSSFTAVASPLDAVADDAYNLAAVVDGPVVQSPADDGGPGTLRTVIGSAIPGAHISFDGALDAQTITLTSGPLTVDKSLVVDARSLPNGLTLSANALSRVLDVQAAGRLELHGLTVTGGTADNGGAIRADGELTLHGCTVTGNTATTAGGGIFIAPTGSASLINSTLSTNTAPSGAGIHNQDGSLTLLHATISGNDAGSQGGGLSATDASTNSLGNSIIAGNSATTSGPDLSAGPSTTLLTSGPNLIGINETAETAFPAGLPNGNGDYAGTTLTPLAPLLATLQDHGGPTATMPPLLGSLAIDAGDSSLADDQRRLLPRPVGPGPDLGAVESFAGGDLSGTNLVGLDLNHVDFTGANLSLANLAGAQLVNADLTDADLTGAHLTLADLTGTIVAGTTFTGAFVVVDTNTDELDAPASGGTGLSLREALRDSFDGMSIYFDPALGGSDIVLDGTALVVDKDLAIDASYLPNGLGIDADASSRILDVAASVNATLAGLHLMAGSTGAEGGAGILNSGDLTITNSTLSGHNTTGDGGAILSPGNLTITNSTLAGNSAAGQGGAISAGATTTLTHCTIAGNDATTLGGGISNSGTLDLDHCIVADNSAGADPDLAGTPAASTLACLLGGNPLLTPLDHYGGPTPVRFPLPGSPAIEGGQLSPSTPATDQTGAPRPAGPLPDIGAVEAVPVSSLGLASNDGDPIPDLLEGPDGPYPHLDPNTDDSAVDTDRDGSTDADELANMTDPYDPDDYFRILTFVRAAGFTPSSPVFEVTIPTFPGLPYELATSTSLDAPFLPVSGSQFAADDYAATIEVELPPGRGFLQARRRE